MTTLLNRLRLAAVAAVATAPWGEARADLSQAGPYLPGSTTVTVTRPDSTTFTALLYYPSTTGGLNAPFDPSGGAYSAIAFGHGFLQAPSRYFGTLEHLASYGHLVIASTSEVSFTPSHANFANDLRLTLDYLTARNNDPVDAFYQQVDLNNFGIFGHSMGGGSSLLAAAEDARIKAVAGLATAITSPSPEPLMAHLRAPVSLLSGDEDGIVPYETATVPLYEAGVAPKLQPLIIGGYHVGFQDNPFPFFPDSGSLPAAEQLAITRAYLTSFFGLYLRDDQSLWRNIWGPEAFADAGLPTLADPGVSLISLEPNQASEPGQTATFHVTLTNTGPVANSFDLFVEDQAWTTDLSALQTPELAPGEQFNLALEVLIPLGASPGDTDALLLSARSRNDGGTRGYAALHAVAVPEPRSIVLLIMAAATLIWTRLLVRIRG